MLTLFRYNWQVRDDWFKWCEQVPDEELQRKRVGGVGSILDTLNHIVNAEVNWIRVLEGNSTLASATVNPLILLVFLPISKVYQIRSFYQTFLLLFALF